MSYDTEEHGHLGRTRHGSPEFYKLLEQMAETHDRKSHDYASNNDPSGNYHFAGQVAQLFKHSPNDAGFVGRIAEKIYRLANLETDGKVPRNESVEDTEIDICTIMVLWMADRRQRRIKLNPMMGDVGLGVMAGPENVLRGAVRTVDPQLATNPLQHELYDLIKLMPDFQTDDLIKFIMDMRQIRRDHKETNQVSKIGLPSQGLQGGRG